MKVAIGPISKEMYGGVTQHVRNIVKFSNQKFYVIVYPKYSLSHPNYRSILPFVKKHQGIHNVVKDPYWFVVENIIYPSCDIVHFHGSPLWPEFHFKKRSTKFKGIHTAHNFYFREDVATQREWNIWRWSNELAIESYRNANKVISVAKWLREFLLKEHNIDSIHIPNGINLVDFKNANPEAFKDKFKIKEDFILFLGRINKSKRPEMFVELAKKIPEKLFLMAGNDVTREHLSTYIGQKPPENVRCLGLLPWKDAINALYACKVFVLPSTNECLPITILEAKACKKVVVAANNRGSKELVDEGVDGFLFESENVEHMYERVCKAMEYPELGENGYKKVIETYTWEKIASQTDKVYESLGNR